ncbi:uncharacterized protein TNCV_2154281 [Trichonephila clavipes]|nr:uncharacterized protein TNCV_2154281 [Trichonephila clavipes]
MSKTFLARNEGCKTPLNVNRSESHLNKAKLIHNANCLLEEREWNEIKSPIPSFVSIFVCCAGFVQASQGRLKVWSFVSFVLLFSTVDFLVGIIVNFKPNGLKIRLTLTLALTLTFLMYFLISRKRRCLSTLLLKLQYLPSSTKERLFNLLMLVIYLIPWAEAIMCCYSILGLYLIGDFGIVQQIQGTTVGVCSFLCLIGTLWTAGTLPIELKKLKDTFYEKAYLRRISFRFLSEENSRTEIFDKPDFVFTGCDVLSYRRSAVFAIVGTLVTYTVLIINMPAI